MQRSFDDLGTPLADVTFVILDLETTGGSPKTCAITEVGAVKFRGGDLLGTFQTLVNPGIPIPPEITYLTGITEAMVWPAPRIEEVLGPFVSFVGQGVIVGHNVRFDLGFLAAAMDRHAWPRFTNVTVDTCALARRLIRDEVPNCKLSTLAVHLRSGHKPTHRALDDARATAEVLHALLERAGSIGVLGLDDLVALPTVASHPQLAKLKLAAGLPRAPGVYLFRDGGGRVLYVGKAVNLRRRVRSYFSSDDRRKVGALLREVATIDHIVCSGELEASVLEVRLIHQLAPRYNRRTKHWRRYAYLKLTLDERFPRLSVVRVPRAGDGCLYLGPLASSAAAHHVAEAILTAVPLRRCAARNGAARRDGPCTAAQLGVAACPCAGTVTEKEYAAIVERVVTGLTDDPG
ncbi:MAG TPA: DEDD exonuclease domain-containing protein, partial [Acidimicrobiales bacterium]|nr:DEDD exonuclease domain-containing protein [Acidimicrobiales bacterium]